MCVVHYESSETAYKLIGTEFSGQNQTFIECLESAALGSSENQRITRSNRNFDQRDGKSQISFKHSGIKKFWGEPLGVGVCHKRRRMTLQDKTCICGDCNVPNQFPILKSRFYSLLLKCAQSCHVLEADLKDLDVTHAIKSFSGTLDEWLTITTFSVRHPGNY
ncbi:hypothetical protein SynBIOSE41_03781 [Synechococcus sp. BIOS-E4-1]|nr:hypothetical protein SynBIOSE41_03781 [Synechococcus sp. BIOS-E4-1]